MSANGNSTIIDPNLFDVERVEFLRGPQGTLFGSGSLAGAVRIITKKPDLTKFDVAGLADLGLTGSDSFRQRYNAMVNVPLVEEIGREHVCTPVTNAHLVCRLLHEQQKTPTTHPHTTIPI